MSTAVKLNVRAPGPTTVEELLAWPDAPAGEIVDGVWIPRDRDGMTGTRFTHGLIAAEILRLLSNYAKAHRLGKVVAAETGFLLRRRPDLMRCPDVAFIAAARLSTGIPDGIFEGAPELAVEVLSPSNTAGDVQQKVAEYLRHGARLVWVADTTGRTVSVHARSRLPRLLRGDDLLDGEDVLPGFSVATCAVFADLDLTDRTREAP